MWNGIRGVLIAKLKKIANHRIFWLSKLMSAKEIICRSDVPTLQMITRKASNMNNDPNSVYRNSKNDARIRVSLAPQIPTMRNSGTSTDSKKTQNNSRSNTTNNAISNVSTSKNAIKKYFRLCCTFSQLAKIAIGIVNVVSRTKYNDNPSIPMCR